MKQHLLDLGRHREQGRHAVGLNRCQCFVGFVAPLHHIGTADHQVRNEKRLHATYVVERRDMQGNVGRLQPILHHAVHRNRDVVVVAVHHALGPAGGARGIHQRRQMVAQGHRTRRMVVDGLVHQRVEVVVAGWHVGRVVGAGDVVVYALQARLDVQHVFGYRAPIDQNAGTRVRQGIRDLAGGEPEVERHGHRAQHLGREIGGDGIFRGGDVERDTVARSYAQVGQRLGEPAHAPVPIAVGPALVLENQGDVVRVTLDRLQKNRCDVHGVCRFGFRGWA